MSHRGDRMIRNVHERVSDAPPTEIGALIDGLASHGGPPLAEQPLAGDAARPPARGGASGGPGSIRHAVSDYEPGRRVRFRIDSQPGLAGHHEFKVATRAGRTTLRHTLDATHGRMRIAWPLIFRWLHEALIEGAETASTGTPVKGRPWRLPVRLVCAALRRQRGRAGRRIVQDPKRESPAAYRVTVERRGVAPLEAQLGVRAASKRAAGELASWIAERERGGMFEATKVQPARRNEIADFDDADPLIREPRP